jgi:TRAP-type uncharacterized transport system substrate-binding protein
VRTSKSFHADEVRRKINENMLVMVSGPFGATYLQLANDIAVAVSQTDSVRVLPVASAGSRTNIGDILYARGVDLGIVSVQVLNAMKDSGEWGPNIDRRISYIAPLAVDTFQVLTRAEYNGLADLKGKKLSFNAKGSGTSVFGPKVLKALGAEPGEEINVGRATPSSCCATVRSMGSCARAQCPSPHSPPSSRAPVSSSWKSPMSPPWSGTMCRQT